MKIHFGQIYVEPGVSFPFSFHFQLRLSAEISALVEESEIFRKKYGPDWSLMFRISAKRQIPATDIRGPSVFRKSRDVEYSVFLPFDIIAQQSDVEAAALRGLLSAVSEVLGRHGVSTTKLEEKKEILVGDICGDPMMFDPSEKKRTEPNRVAGGN